MVKKILLGVLLLILGIVGYYVYMFTRNSSHDSGPKTPPLVIKKHSDTELQADPVLWFERCGGRRKTEIENAVM